MEEKVETTIMGLHWVEGLGCEDGAMDLILPHRCWIWAPGARAMQESLR